MDFLHRREFGNHAAGKWQFLNSCLGFGWHAACAKGWGKLGAVPLCQSGGNM